MPNNYNTTIRELRARNLYEAALSLPNDFTLDASASLFQMFNPYSVNTLGMGLNVNSNINIVSLGVYSNFADGLVFANPYERIDIFLWTKGYYIPTITPTGVITTAINSKNVTGTGFDTFLDNSAIAILHPVTGTYEFATKVSDAAGGTTAVLSDYPTTALAGASYFVLADQGSLASYTMRGIGELNTQFSVNKFLSVGSGLNINTDIVILYASISPLIGPQSFALVPTEHDTVFHTAGINTAFDEAVCRFDIVGQFEYTEV